MVVAGDFVAMPRLNGTRTGDTLAPKGQPVMRARAHAARRRRSASR